MIAVLISIRPKWCEKIISGEKTIEVRKTRPKMDTPFKCYIYKCGNGKVIGEFLCDEISNINFVGRPRNAQQYANQQACRACRGRQGRVRRDSAVQGGRYGVV